jgi:hypothetical protein
MGVVQGSSTFLSYCGILRQVSNKQQFPASPISASFFCAHVMVSRSLTHAGVVFCSGMARYERHVFIELERVDTQPTTVVAVRVRWRRF